MLHETLLLYSTQHNTVDIFKQVEGHYKFILAVCSKLVSQILYKRTKSNFAHGNNETDFTSYFITHIS